jgi:hypothetical protein
VGKQWVGGQALGEGLQPTLQNHIRCFISHLREDLKNSFEEKIF